MEKKFDSKDLNLVEKYPDEDIEDIMRILMMKNPEMGSNSRKIYSMIKKR